MIRGGLRTRLIVDSVRVAIIAALGDLGWFDPTVHDNPPGARQHAPLRYMPKPLRWDEMVEPNAIAISSEDTLSLDAGLGGEVEDNIRMYADIFAQGDEFGMQLAQDIRDLAIGKMPDIGRDSPHFDVYDLRLATPTVITHVDVEQPIIDRASSESREWRNRWFMVRFDLVDEYHDEFATLSTNPDAWFDEFAQAWQQIQAIELA